jgi:hypothetical protein
MRGPCSDLVGMSYPSPLTEFWDQAITMPFGDRRTCHGAAGPRSGGRRAGTE